MNVARHIAFAAISFFVLMLSPISAAWAQVKVTSASPASAAQGTISLDVTVNGSGFDSTAKAKFLVTGTTDTGGITVTKVVVKGSKQLVATIDVADTALVTNFDIEVTLSTGRKGKGTTLFAVLKTASDPCAAAGLDFPAFIYWVTSGSSSREMYVADSTGTCRRSVITPTFVFPASASFSYPVVGTSNVGRAIWIGEEANLYAIDFTVTGTSITPSPPRIVGSMLDGTAFELSSDGNVVLYGVGAAYPSESPKIRALNLSTSVTTELWTGPADGSTVNWLAANADGSALFVDLVPMSGPGSLMRIDVPCIGTCATVLYSNAVGTQGPIFPSASLIPDAALGYPLLVYADFLAGYNQCFQLRFADFSGNPLFTGTQPRYGKTSTWYGGKVLTDGYTAPSRRGTCAATGVVTLIDPATGAETPLVSGSLPDAR